MARKTIALSRPRFQSEDGVAAEAITPGHLVMGVTSLTKNTENGVLVARVFALERDEMGDEIDVAYAIGDTVKTGHFAPGDRVLAWVPSGTNVAEGAYLATDNGGRLVAVGGGTRIARALEAKNVLADTRIRVELV